MSLNIQNISDVKQRHISPIEVITVSIPLKDHPRIDISCETFQDRGEFNLWPHLHHIKWGNSQFTRDIRRAFTLFAEAVHEHIPNPSVLSPSAVLEISRTLHVVGTLCDVYSQLNTDLPLSNIYAVRFTTSDLLGLSLFLEHDPTTETVMKCINVIKPVTDH